MIKSADDAIAKTRAPPLSVCPCCQIFTDGGGGNWFLPAAADVAAADREEGAALPRPASLPSSSFRSNSENSLRAMVEEPRRAWKFLRQRGRCRLVDTHGHAHLERNNDESSSSKLYRDDDDDDDASNTEEKQDNDSAAA